MVIVQLQIDNLQGNNLQSFDVKIHHNGYIIRYGRFDLIKNYEEIVGKIRKSVQQVQKFMQKRLFGTA